MAEYKTPGVYVEEISKFPTSVVRVATAVPVFIGYTEISTPVTLRNVPIKVRSLVEFERIFGGEPPSGSGRELTVELDPGNGYSITSVNVGLTYYLYQSLRLFYANGGGDAYIMSIGDYSGGAPAIGAFDPAVFAELEKVDEPTLLLVPDAWAYAAASDLGNAQKQMLIHCDKMQDRFSILDVKHDSAYLLPGVAGHDADDFRDQVGIQNLKYGAAYYPELLTSLGPNGPIGLGSFVLNPGAMSVDALGLAIGDQAIIGYTNANTDAGVIPDLSAYEAFKISYDALTPALAINGIQLAQRLTIIKSIVDLIYGYRYPTASLSNVLVQELVSDIAFGTSSPLFTIVQKMLDYDDGYATVDASLGIVTVANYAAYGLSVGAVPGFYTPATEPAAPQAATPFFDDLFEEAYGYLGQIRDLVNTIATGDDLFSTSRKLAEIRDAIRNTGYTLPPSGAIAGIYAVNDANRGVWHAPANMSLNAVRDVARKMQTTELDDLNIPNAGNGKSVNAIRPFRGQGILVYGARTLAGNDNEWRYVSVRRLFIMVEESVKKATEPFVFEPNDANTWIKIKGMIENFLLGLWRDGALAGAVPKDAFFVKCGIGQTMTADDILNGKLIVEIGMAAVRPAEFVIIKFMHKIQES